VGSGRQLWAATGETARATSTNAVLLLDDWPLGGAGTHGWPWPHRAFRDKLRWRRFSAAGNLRVCRQTERPGRHGLQTTRTPRFSFRCN
jgi:hypothetical protein